MDIEDYLEPDEVAGRSRVGAGALVFKDACDGCDIAITWVDPAFICLHECTWCPECAESHSMVCPHCSGELSQRPSRTQHVGRKAPGTRSTGLNG